MSAYRGGLAQRSHVQQLRKDSMKDKSDGKTMEKRKQLVDDLKERKY